VNQATKPQLRAAVRRIEDLRKQLNEMTKNAALEQQEVLRVSRMLDEEINNYYRLLARTQ